MPNLTEADYKKMKIDKSFKAYKRDNLKVFWMMKSVTVKGTPSQKF